MFRKFLIWAVVVLSAGCGLGYVGRVGSSLGSNPASSSPSSQPNYAIAKPKTEQPVVEKKTLVARAPVRVSVKVPAKTLVREGFPSPQLVAALIQKESHGNDFAIGDKNFPKEEWAYGCLQIRQCCVDDVNRRYGTHYKSTDCLGNRELSIWICQRYIAMYATEKRLHRPPTDQDRARIWNGGPLGWERACTLDYWAKVQEYLK